jgi:hypothetical protein
VIANSQLFCREDFLGFMGCGCKFISNPIVSVDANSYESSKVIYEWDCDVGACECI